MNGAAHGAVIREDDDVNEYEDDCCECGGDGFVVNCFDEGACADPESGCDYCTRPCPDCHTKHGKRQEGE